MDLERIHLDTMLSEIISEGLVPEIKVQIKRNPLLDSQLPLELGNLRAILRNQSEGKDRYEVQYPYTYPPLERSSKHVIKVNYTDKNGNIRNHILPVAFESKGKINQIIDLEIPKDDKGNRFPFLLFLPFDFGYGILIYPDTYPKYDPNNLPQNATIAREDLPYLELIETSTLLDALTDLNWPPSSGYYPEILKYLSKNINNIDQDILLKMILERFNKDYWRERINYWKLTELFNGRIVYIERAIERYFENDFVSSINVLAPQFEGIVWDYVSANINKNKKVKIENFKENVRELKRICESRTIILLKRKMLNVICQYLIEGPLYKSTPLVDPHQQVSRHSIAHPVYIGFENKNLSLKYLLVLDSLAYILNLDRIVSGEFAKGKYNVKKT